MGENNTFLWYSCVHYKSPHTTFFYQAILEIHSYFPMSRIKNTIEAVDSQTTPKTKLRFLTVAAICLLSFKTSNVFLQSIKHT